VEIQYKTQYAVTHNGEIQRFDTASEAWAVARETLLAAYNKITAEGSGDFDGSISWETETDEVPATPLDEFILSLDLYDDGTGGDGGVGGVNRDDPYIMVEECRYGCVVSSGTSPDELVRKHRSDGGSDDWGLEGIYDSRTGAPVHGTFTEKVEY
jgi:hypothetical protein